MKLVTTLLLLLVVQFAFAQEKKRLMSLPDGEQTRITTRAEAIDTLYRKNKSGRTVDSLLVIRYTIDYYLNQKEERRIVEDTLSQIGKSEKLLNAIREIVDQQYKDE